MRSIAVRNQRITFFSILCVIVAIIIGSVLLGSIKTQAATTEISYKYYTSVQLQKGDTLWNIADEYMTEEYTSTDEYITELCALNHISVNDPIHSGQYLTVPYYSDSYLE